MTNGRLSYGIRNQGANNTTTVSGSIVTNGFLSHGIRNDGNDNTTAVSGSIVTNGNFSYGIRNMGDNGNNTTTVSGSIVTNGHVSDGIFNQGNDNTTTVSGSITTEGESSNGIRNDGNDNTTTVSGSIATNGQNSHGIRNNGNDNTITISGTVSATHSSSNALFNSISSDISFILDEGAVIIGDITAFALAGAPATNNKLTLNLGQGASYAYSVGGGGAITDVGTGAGRWTFSDQDGRKPKVTINGTNCAASSVTVCNLVTAVGSGNAMEQDELQFAVNSAMIDSLEFGSGQANAAAESMTSAQTAKSNTWANLYGGTSKRAASTTQSSFYARNAGLTIGTPVAISDSLNIDLVLNMSRSNLNISPSKDQEITAQSYNLGAALRDLVPSDTWSVDAFGFIGHNAYDGKRKVMNNDTATGSETVTASYSGLAVLVGVNAQYSQAIDDTLNFIGGLNASLSNERIGAYSESKYFAWDARTMTLASGGFTVGLEYHTATLTTFASLGAQRSSLRSGKTAGYTNNGTAGSYTDSTNGDTYRTASIGFDYAGEGGVYFTGALEPLSSSGGVSGNSTSFSVGKKF